MSHQGKGRCCPDEEREMRGRWRRDRTLKRGMRSGFLTLSRTSTVAPCSALFASRSVRAASKFPCMIAWCRGAQQCSCSPRHPGPRQFGNFVGATGEVHTSLKSMMSFKACATPSESLFFIALTTALAAASMWICQPHPCHRHAVKYQRSRLGLVWISSAVPKDQHLPYPWKIRVPSLEW